MKRERATAENPEDRLGKDRSGRRLVLPMIMAVLVGLLWIFPRFWYNRTGDGSMRWLSERKDVPGWSYRDIPVDESAERILVADRMFSAEYTNAPGGEIHVFSAKRYDEKANEIGLFIHTPDRCWVEAGWRCDAEAAPTFKEISLDGARVTVERRVFELKGRRELVYFFGMQDGRSLPYRLDHYLATSRRFSAQGDKKRELVRASDLHFWGRLWESFKSRREVRGPKQFVRVSTMLGAEEVGAADERLERFVKEWLVPADYATEKAEWLAAASTKIQIPKAAE